MYQAIANITSQTIVEGVTEVHNSKDNGILADCADVCSFYADTCVCGTCNACLLALICCCSPCCFQGSDIEEETPIKSSVMSQKTILQAPKNVSLSKSNDFFEKNK